MHAVLMDSLEDYLSGTLEPRVEKSIEAHLNACDSCREELRAIEDVSHMFVTLQSGEVVEPGGAFYANVMRRVASQRTAPSFAGWYRLDFAFGRRLVFASLLMLAVLGSYLISRESGYPAGASPEAIMAEQESPAFDSAPGPDNMLVTLTAYEH